MDKTTLNAQIVTTETCFKRSDLWKVLVWLSMKKNE